MIPYIDKIYTESMKPTFITHPLLFSGDSELRPWPIAAWYLAVLLGREFQDFDPLKWILGCDVLFDI